MESSDEWLEWYRMTPAQRFEASMALWPHFIAMGGSCDPDPDYQSPFFDEDEWRALADDGGQACVLYGAAEFSRDLDLVIQVDESNLHNLEKALEALEASVIAVPPFERRYLESGHAVHLERRAIEVEDEAYWAPLIHELHQLRSMY